MGDASAAIAISRSPQEARARGPAVFSRSGRSHHHAFPPVFLPARGCRFRPPYFAAGLADLQKKSPDHRACLEVRNPPGRVLLNSGFLLWTFSAAQGLRREAGAGQMSRPPAPARKAGIKVATYIVRIRKLTVDQPSCEVCNFLRGHSVGGKSISRARAIVCALGALVHFRLCTAEFLPRPVRSTGRMALIGA
jgi:hypothetical protein